MDEKLPKPAFRISIMLALLLTALAASLLATWRVNQMSANRDIQMDFDRNQRNASSIQPGMTMTEVDKIMGHSGAVNLNKWLYLGAEDQKRGEWLTIEIIFEDGRVKEVANGRIPFPPPPYVYVPSP